MVLYPGYASSEVAQGTTYGQLDNQGRSPGAVSHFAQYTWDDPGIVDLPFSPPTDDYTQNA